MLTRTLLVFFFAVALVHCSDAGSRKSQELRAKIEASPTIPLISGQEYKYFLEESPRPYDVVVYFRIAENCGLCDEVEEELNKVYSLYKKGGAIYPFSSGDNKQRAVYFVKLILDPSTRPIFFNTFGFKSVPNLLISTPKMLRLRDTEKTEHMRNYLWQISSSDGTITSQKLLEHINRKTGRNVEYKESVLNLLFVLIVLGSLLAVGVAAFLKFRPFFLSTKLWFIGSMLVYFICMSGIVYNILHGVPFNNVDREGNVEWIHSGGRSQFGAEGYLMSGAISTLGILFIVLLHIPKFFANDSSTSRIAYAVVIVMIFLVLKWVEGVYKYKSSFYSPVFSPPAHYMHGPLSNDQGNNI